MAGAELNLTFADGEIAAVAGAGGHGPAVEEPPAKKRVPAKKPATGGQGSLF